MKLTIQDLEVPLESFQLGPLGLELEREDYLVLAGPSGSGKTTLLRALAGLATPTAGKIRFGDRDLFVDGKSLPPEKRRIGLLFQNLSLWPHLTVSAHLELVMRYRKIPAGDIATKTRNLLEMVHLEQAADKKPPKLSGGEAQRLALARALASEPELLLLDEPFGQLDTHLRLELAEEVDQIRKQSGIPVIHVSHDPAELMEPGRKIGVMRSGRLEQVADLSTCLNSPATPFVAQYFRPIQALFDKLEGIRREAN